MRTHAQRPSRGFTLIELLVSVAVLVVVLSLAAPSFQKVIAAQRVKNASFDLFSALNYARSEAVKRNGSISLRAGASTSGAWNTGWRIDDGTTVLRSWAATNNLTVTEQSGGATTVTYGRDGRLTTATVLKLDVRPSVTLTGVNPRCVQVDLSGRPTTQSGACS